MGGLLPPMRDGSTCNVVFTWKQGSHGNRPINNANQVSEFLDQWAKRHGTSYANFNLGDLSLLDQLKAFQVADIHVTVAGSTSFAALNLGPRSDMILLGASSDKDVFLSSDELEVLT